VETLGEYLRNRRQAKNISLEQIAQITKINISYLHAIERDEFHKLPAPAFTRGFLKLYAQCVGLDPGEVVLRFNRSVQGEDESGTRVSTGGRPGRRLRRRLVVFAVACLVVAGTFFAVGHRTKTRVERPRQEAPSAPSEELQSSGAAEEPVAAGGQQVPVAEEALPQGNEIRAQSEPAGETVSAESAQAGPGVSTASPETAQAIALLVDTMQRTWVRVSIDRNPPFEVMLHPGERVLWKGAERIHLRIGNAGGIRITYNGTPLGDLGKSGEVIEREFPEPHQ